MAWPSRRNSGFQTRATPGCTSWMRPWIRSAVPTGTVDLPTTTSPGRRWGRRSSTATLTYDRSAAFSPLCCGVPTQRKCTRAPAASDGAVLKLSSPSRSVVRKHLVQPGLVERCLPLGQHFDLRLEHVDADDVVAQLRHARRVHRSEVAAPEH